jgi:hypothetical protein
MRPRVRVRVRIWVKVRVRARVRVTVRYMYLVNVCGRNRVSRWLVANLGLPLRRVLHIERHIGVGVYLG